MYHVQVREWREKKLEAMQLEAELEAQHRQRMEERMKAEAEEEKKRRQKEKEKVNHFVKAGFGQEETSLNYLPLGIVSFRMVLEA